VTEISDRYRRLAGGFTARVEAIPRDDPRWAAPSPCEGWTARDVVDHLVGAHRLFFGLVGHEVPEPPPVAEDPAKAWTATRAAMVAALEDPDVAQREYEGMFGRARFEDSVARFLCFDLLVHGWDLARAAGLDDRLDADEVRACFAAAQAFGDAMRQPGAFGPEVPAPADADEQEKLLAFLGRDPRWQPPE
jgi:uncharacterized protein (TIGR03086 family)